jgi:uncharacterized membrane-anchored protein
LSGGSRYFFFGDFQMHRLMNANAQARKIRLSAPARRPVQTRHFGIFLCLGLTMSLCQLLISPMAIAQQAPAPDNAAAAPAPESEARQALEGISKTGTRGPAKITLRDQAVLNLPENMIFADAQAGMRFMLALGNQVDEHEFVGLIMPTAQSGGWLMTIDYVKDGYVSDSDSTKIDADDLLKTLRDGTESSNEFRSQHGIPALEVTGWAEKPAYDSARHALVWSALAKEKGSNPPMSEQTVNYNTRLLGRDGYFSITMIDVQANLAPDVEVAKNLISATDYNPGKRYSDFNSSTDKVAQYGLLALIGGVAAKKLGLLAVLGIWLLKIWKLAAIGIAGLATAARKWFRKSSS